jgi:hypothetical protein
LGVWTGSVGLTGLPQYPQKLISSGKSFPHVLHLVIISPIGK